MRHAEDGVCLPFLFTYEVAEDARTVRLKSEYQYRIDEYLICE